MKRRALHALLAVALLACAPLLASAAVREGLPGLLQVGASDVEALPAPPVLSLLEPADGQGVPFSFRLSGVARSDARTILDVEIQIDGSGWRSLPEVPRNQAAAPFATALQVDEGAHLVEVRAFDGETYSLVARRLVKAGSPTPPTLTIAHPAEGDGLEEGTIEFSGFVSGRASRVVLLWNGTLTEASLVSGGDRASWRATLALPAGIHEVRAQAFGAQASLPRAVRVAIGAIPPPQLDVASPQPGAAFGSAGDPACAQRCLLFTGTLRASGSGAGHVEVELDGTPWGPPVPAIPAGTWAWRLSMDRLYAGAHVARFTPVDAEGHKGVAVEVPFCVRVPKSLLVEGDVAPRSTLLPLSFRVEGESVGSARWHLDGETVGTGRALSVQLATPGDHDLEVQVEDGRGRSASLRVPLYALNRPPVAQLVIEPALAASPTRLEALAKDLDGRVVEYRWDLGDGSEARTGEAAITHAYARSGVYEARVVPVDDRGAAGAPSQGLVVVHNAPPLADFRVSPDPPSLLDEIRFEDLSVDPEGALAGRLWDFGDGNTSTLPAPVHRFATRGAHEVTLRVVDAEGASAHIRRTVEVTNLAPRPDFRTLPETPTTGMEVVFLDATQKPDGRIVSWAWDFGDGATATGAALAHAYDAPGTYEVALTVTDDWGETARLARPLVVSDAPPDVRRVLVEPALPSALQNVSFHAVAFDREGGIVETAWDFGDGNASLQREPVHRYARSGVYQASLAVKDETGLVTVHAFDVVVSGLRPEVALLVAEGGFAAFPTLLRAEASDADGTLVRYAFDADGDGVADCEGPEPSCRFVYPHAESYLSRVTVTDDEGAQATAERVVDVVPPPPGLAPPRVHVDAPLEGANLRGSVLLSGRAEGPVPVVLVEVQVRNATWRFAPGSATAWTRAEGTGAWSLLLDTRRIPDGAYELAVRAHDREGAVGEARVSLLVTNGRPPSDFLLEAANLEAGQLVRDDLLVQGTAYHPGGVHAVRYRLDEGPWREAQGAPLAWAVPLSRRDLAPGPHLLEVQAHRGIGEQEVLRIPFTFAPQGPLLHVDEPPPATAFGLLRAAGRVAGNATVLWRLDGGLWRELPAGPAWLLEQRTLEETPGLRTVSFKAVARDGSGESEEIPYKVRILNPLPDEPQRASAPPAPEPARTTPGGGAFLVALALGAATFGAPRRRL